MPSVFITGASTGIGRDASHRMALRGWTVFGGVRSDSDASSLERNSQGRVRPVLCDVTSIDQVAAAGEEILSATNGYLSGLVNNAGIVRPGPIEMISLEDLREQFEVNVVGQVGVTQVFLPALRREAGRIVNVGSISGMFTAPIVGAYSMSKHAMEAMNDGLRRELASWNISVSLIQPGPVETPIWQKALARAQPLRDAMSDEHRNLYGGAIDSLARGAANEKSVGVETVTDAIEHALTDRKPKTRYPVGPNAKLITVLRRILPDRLLDRLLDYV